MIFPGEKEVLWDCKESCHMKSGGETVKENRVGICCGFADVHQWPVDLWTDLHFRGGQLCVEQPLVSFSFALLEGGMVVILIFLFRRNEILCQSKQFPWLFCTITFLLPLVAFPKVVETPWFAQCLLHRSWCRNVLNSHHKYGSEWGTWKVEEMETELAFTLLIF